MSKGMAGAHCAGVGERRREVEGWWSVRRTQPAFLKLKVRIRGRFILMNSSLISRFRDGPFLASLRSFLTKNSGMDKSPSMVGKRNFTDNPEVI